VILLATRTTLVPYAFSAAAQVYLYFTDKASFVGRYLIRDTIVAGLAFAYSMWAIGNSGDDTIQKGFMLLMAGIPVYIAVKLWPRKTEVPPAEINGAGPKVTRFETESEKRTPVAR
jgi:APA family basic amino acid/polyamine antiporter